MKSMRKIVQIDETLCDGCGECITACAEGALKILDGKASLVAEIYCDGLGACLGGCPRDAIRIIEREADAFDEKAVEDHLKSATGETHSGHAQPACPSARLHTFAPSCAEMNRPVGLEASQSALSHWPVQIRLVPPTAPFLRQADILVAADCVPFACADFHRDFLTGKKVLVGCPKFDDIQDYIRKFADIFSSADVRSVTTIEMEVPCCSRLPVIVQKGMDIAGKKVPFENVVIGVRGDILKREKIEP